MKIVTINGSPKKSGFSSKSIEIVSKSLTEMGADVVKVDLRDKAIDDCIGCLKCMREGKCSIKDDMGELTPLFKSADGFVVASPVRNGTITSLYKRFYERAIYPLGFPSELEEKYVLSICSVGMATGKKENKRLLCLGEFGATSVDYIFTKVGMPPKKTPDGIKERLTKGAKKLYKAIEGKKPPGLITSIKRRLDRWIMKKFLLKKQPDVFAYVIKRYSEKGYID